MGWSYCTGVSTPPAVEYCDDFKNCNCTIESISITGLVGCNPVGGSQTCYTFDDNLVCWKNTSLFLKATYDKYIVDYGTNPCAAGSGGLKPCGCTDTGAPVGDCDCQYCPDFCYYVYVLQYNCQTGLFVGEDPGYSDADNRCATIFSMTPPCSASPVAPCSLSIDSLTCSIAGIMHLFDSKYMILNRWFYSGKCVDLYPPSVHFNDCAVCSGTGLQYDTCATIDNSSFLKKFYYIKKVAADKNSYSKDGNNYFCLNCPNWPDKPEPPTHAEAANIVECSCTTCYVYFWIGFTCAGGFSASIIQDSNFNTCSLPDGKTANTWMYRDTSGDTCFFEYYIPVDHDLVGVSCNRFSPNNPAINNNFPADPPFPGTEGSGITVDQAKILCGCSIPVCPCTANKLSIKSAETTTNYIPTIPEIINPETEEIYPSFHFCIAEDPFRKTVLFTGYDLYNDVICFDILSEDEYSIKNAKNLNYTSGYALNVDFNTNNYSLFKTFIKNELIKNISELITNKNYYNPFSENFFQYQCINNVFDWILHIANYFFINKTKKTEAGLIEGFNGFRCEYSYDTFDGTNCSGNISNTDISDSNRFTAKCWHFTDIEEYKSDIIFFGTTAYFDTLSTVSSQIGQYLYAYGINRFLMKRVSTPVCKTYSLQVGWNGIVPVFEDRYYIEDITCIYNYSYYDYYAYPKVTTVLKYPATTTLNYIYGTSAWCNDYNYFLTGCVEYSIVLYSGWAVIDNIENLTNNIYFSYYNSYSDTLQSGKYAGFCIEDYIYDYQNRKLYSIKYTIYNNEMYGYGGLYNTGITSLTKILDDDNLSYFFDNIIDFDSLFVDEQGNVNEWLSVFFTDNFFVGPKIAYQSFPIRRTNFGKSITTEGGYEIIHNTILSQEKVLSLEKYKKTNDSISSEDSKYMYVYNMSDTDYLQKIKIELPDYNNLLTYLQENYTNGFVESDGLNINTGVQAFSGCGGRKLLIFPKTDVVIPQISEKQSDNNKGQVFVNKNKYIPNFFPFSQTIDFRSLKSSLLCFSSNLVKNNFKDDTYTLGVNTLDIPNTIVRGKFLSKELFNQYKINGSKFSTIYDSSNKIYVFFEDIEDYRGILASKKPRNISCAISYDNGETWFLHKNILNLINDEFVSKPYVSYDYKKKILAKLYFIMNDNYICEKDIDLTLFDNQDAYKNISINNYTDSGKTLRSKSITIIDGKDIPNNYTSNTLTETGYNRIRFSGNRETICNVSFKDSVFSSYVDNRGVDRLWYILENRKLGIKSSHGGYFWIDTLKNINTYYYQATNYSEDWVARERFYKDVCNGSNPANSSNIEQLLGNIDFYNRPESYSDVFYMNDKYNVVNKINQINTVYDEKTDNVYLLFVANYFGEFLRSYNSGLDFDSSIYTTNNLLTNKKSTLCSKIKSIFDDNFGIPDTRVNNIQNRNNYKTIIPEIYTTFYNDIDGTHVNWEYVSLNDIFVKNKVVESLNMLYSSLTGFAFDNIFQKPCPKTNINGNAFGLINDISNYLKIGTDYYETVPDYEYFNNNTIKTFDVSVIPKYYTDPVRCFYEKYSTGTLNKFSDKIIIDSNANYESFQYLKDKKTTCGSLYRHTEYYIYKVKINQHRLLWTVLKNACYDSCSTGCVEGQFNCINYNITLDSSSGIKYILSNTSLTESEIYDRLSSKGLDPFDGTNSSGSYNFLNLDCYYLGNYFSHTCNKCDSIVGGGGGDFGILIGIGTPCSNVCKFCNNASAYALKGKYWWNFEVCVGANSFSTSVVKIKDFGNIPPFFTTQYDPEIYQYKTMYGGNTWIIYSISSIETVMNFFLLNAPENMTYGTGTYGYDYEYSYAFERSLIRGFDNGWLNNIDEKTEGYENLQNKYFNLRKDSPNKVYLLDNIFDKDNEGNYIFNENCGFSKKISNSYLNSDSYSYSSSFIQPDGYISGNNPDKINVFFGESFPFFFDVKPLSTGYNNKIYDPTGFYIDYTNNYNGLSQKISIKEYQLKMYKFLNNFEHVFTTE